MKARMYIDSEAEAMLKIQYPNRLLSFIDRKDEKMKSNRRAVETIATGPLLPSFMSFNASLAVLRDAKASTKSAKPSTWLNPVIKNMKNVMIVSLSKIGSGRKVIDPEIKPSIVPTTGTRKKYVEAKRISYTPVGMIVKNESKARKPLAKSFKSIT